MEFKHANASMLTGKKCQEEIFKDIKPIQIYFIIYCCPLDECRVKCNIFQMKSSFLESLLFL